VYEVDRPFDRAIDRVPTVSRNEPLIIEHHKRQDQEREDAGTEWHEGGWMFAQPTAKPLDPRRDQYQWKELLKEAGVHDARLHVMPTSGRTPCSAAVSGLKMSA
jgi:hypothetical protein